MVRLAAVAALAACACYSPPLADCRVRCALDGTCPRGLECDNSNYCRTADHALGPCMCEPGDQRVCGTDIGECRTGIQRCTDAKQFGPCEGGVEPTDELCDSRDNDCDGTVDDNPVDAPPCELTLGVCSGTVHACVGGRYAGVCLEEYGADYQRFEKSCDLRDNDCDGIVDRRADVVLATASSGFELVGLDRGFALAIGADAGSSWSVRLFDEKLDPLGGPVALGTAAGPTSVRGVGTGGVAWFVWQRGGATPPVDLAGASVDLSSPAAAAVPLGGLVQPGQLGAVSIGTRGPALLAAWPADGGIAFAEWGARSGAPALTFVTPPQPRFASAYEVGLSSRGQALTFAGRYYTDDAGTTDFGDGVLSLADGGWSTKYVATRSALIDSALGTHAVFDGFCDYSVLGFTCRRSYLATDFQVLNPSSVVRESRISVPGTVSGSSAAPLGASWVAAWLEGTQLYVGVPAPGSTMLSVTRVPVPISAYGPTRVATAGGELAAIVYVANGVGQLNGALVCP